MAIRAKTLITLIQERQVTTVRNFYKATSTNTKPSAISSSSISDWTNQGWLTAEPAYNASTPYVWLCMQTLFGEYNATTNPNNYINSEVSLSSSYTAAISANVLAESIAANTASFWTRYTDGHDKNDSSIPILAGAYASSNPHVDYLDTSTFDYNSYFGANALTFRYKTLNLAKYGTSGVQIYKVATGTTYKLSTDTTVNSSKTYYIYSNNTFTKVISPSGNPSTNNYYEAVATLSQSDPVIELTYDIIDKNGTPGIENRLTFYDPKTNNRSMELKDSELAFYLPINGSTKAASLTSSGLTLSKGGIRAGTARDDGFIYLSSENFTDSISGHSNGTISLDNYTATDWRQLIGTKFGVRADGTLYASNAVISGTITVGSDSNVYTKTEADAAITSLNIIDDTINILTWLSEHGQFDLSHDTSFIVNKQYYIGDQDYYKTEDTQIVSSKDYYIRTGTGTENDPYVYILVREPDIDFLENYYEFGIVGYSYFPMTTDYSKTADTSIDPNKTYYIRSGKGIGDDPYIYTPVQTPSASDLNEYYEYNGNPQSLGLYELIDVSESVTNFLDSHLTSTSQDLWLIQNNNNDYRIRIANDGVYFHGPTGVLSKFGQNVEFSDTIPQHIGGENAYIQFVPDHYRITDDTIINNEKQYYIRSSGTGTIEDPYVYTPVQNPISSDLNEYYEYIQATIDIIANSIQIGTRDASTVFDSTEERLNAAESTIGGHTNRLEQQQTVINNIEGYVTINAQDGFIQVGKKDKNSYVKIDGETAQVNINVGGKDVAYMSQDRFYAPSAVVTNLYMKSDLSGSPIGDIGWVMRSNRHLSLKRIT